MPRHYHRQPYEQQAAREHHERKASGTPPHRGGDGGGVRIRINVRFDSRTTGTIFEDALELWRVKYPHLVILS